jgi:hypothetical protein
VMTGHANQVLPQISAVSLSKHESQSDIVSHSCGRTCTAGYDLEVLTFVVQPRTAYVAGSRAVP